MSKKHWINMGTVASVTEDKLDKSRIHAISCDSNEMHSSENSQHRFTCYQQRKSDSSLLKAFLSWFSNSIVLMILFIPFMCIISILSLVLLPVSFRLFGVYVVFIWAVTVLPIFYMLNALNIAHYDVAIFLFHISCCDPCGISRIICSCAAHQRKNTVTRPPRI
eukprot:333933_1